MKLRFSIRSTLVILAAAAVASAFIAPRFQPDPYERSIVRSKSEFDQRCQDGNCLVYFDADWDMTCELFKITAFREVARAGYASGSIKPTVINAGTSEGMDLASSIVSHLEFDSPTPRSPSLVGVLIWLRDGKRIDHAKYTDYLFIDDGKKKLAKRTASNFN